MVPAPGKATVFNSVGEAALMVRMTISPVSPGQTDILNQPVRVIAHFQPDQGFRSPG